MIPQKQMPVLLSFKDSRIKLAQTPICSFAHLLICKFWRWGKRAFVLVSLLLVGVFAGVYLQTWLEHQAAPQQPDCLRVSLHNHTRFGGTITCTVPPEELVKEAIAKGIDILALTEWYHPQPIDGYTHAYDYLRERATEALPDYSVEERGGLLEVRQGQEVKIYLLRGTEFHPRAGHVLGIGYQDVISAHDDEALATLIAKIRAQGGLVIAAHPLNPLSGGMGVGGIKAHHHLLDALEWNSQNLLWHRKANQTLFELSGRYNLPLLAASDTHLLADVDNAYLSVPRKLLRLDSGTELVTSLREAIAQGKFENHYGYAYPHDVFRWMVWTRIRTGKWRLLCKLLPL